LVEIFYRLGVRWMLIAYNKNNKLGGGCMDDDTGLTAYGRHIIDEMERVGMVLCCTHVGHRTALEAMEYARNPVIFSHSNPSSVYPHVRNISDELLIACARSGGVVSINGVGLFLGAAVAGVGDNRTETLLRHIDYVVQLIGPEHVGWGLDYVFDVSELEEYVRKNPDKFPAGLGQSGSYRQVEPERFRLSRRGYSRWVTARLMCRGSWEGTIGWRGGCGNRLAVGGESEPNRGRPNHIVVDHELLPVSANERAHTGLLLCAEADLVALVIAPHAVVPGAHWRIALQRFALQLMRKVQLIEVSSPCSDAVVVRAADSAQVVGIVLLCVDMTANVAAGVDGLQFVKPALERPGRALATILRVSRRTGGDLVGLERMAYHRERNHQGLGNQLVVPLRVPRSKSALVDPRTRLGGMLSYYERVAG
jgi:Membrane dipeptidase (Peptidase family M19)